MVVLGIILVLIAVALGTLLYLGTAELTAPADQVQLSVLGTDVGFQPLALIIAGALVMLLLWLGLVVLRLAFRRGRKRKASAREAETRLAAERAESERQAAERGAAQRALAEQRSRSVTDGPTAPGSRMGTAGPGTGALSISDSGTDAHSSSSGSSSSGSAGSGGAGSSDSGSAGTFTRPVGSDGGATPPRPGTALPDSELPPPPPRR